MMGVNARRSLYRGSAFTSACSSIYQSDTRSIRCCRPADRSAVSESRYTRSPVDQASNEAAVHFQSCLDTIKVFRHQRGDFGPTRTLDLLTRTLASMPLGKRSLYRTGGEGILRIRAWSLFVDAYGRLETAIDEFQRIRCALDTGESINPRKHILEYLALGEYVLWLVEQAERTARQYWCVVARHHLHLHGPERQRFLRRCRRRTREAFSALCECIFGDELP